jgi:hypothetical protein
MQFGTVRLEYAICALVSLQSVISADVDTWPLSVCVRVLYRTVTLGAASGCDAHHRDAVSDVDTMHLLLCYRGLAGDDPVGLAVCRWSWWSSVLCLGSPLDAVFRRRVFGFDDRFLFQTDSGGI